MEREAAIAVWHPAAVVALPIGLTSAEAVRRRGGFGSNALSEEAPTPWRVRARKRSVFLAHEAWMRSAGFVMSVSCRIEAPSHARRRRSLVQELRAFAMAKLKLSTVQDDRPVKLTVELPAAVHRDLVAYAELLACQNGHEIEPAKLVAPMLARFTSTDRAFLGAWRKGKGTT